MRIHLMKGDIHQALVGLIITMLMLGTSHARQINWRSITGKENLTSEGLALTSAFAFELGCFDSGFTPTATNTAEWASHWTGVARTAYRESDSAFSAAYVVESNMPPTTTGKDAYIWGYSTTGDADEWILVRKSNWTWPSPSSSSLPLTWVVTSSGLEAVVGAVGASGDPTYLTTARVDGTPPVLLPMIWLQQHFPSDQNLDASARAWQADPDQDGLTNEMEYALNLDPRALSALEDRLSVDWLDTNQVRLTLSRSNDRLTSIGIEYSEDHSFWTRQGDLNAGGYVIDNLERQVLEKNVANVERQFYRIHLQWLVQQP